VLWILRSPLSAGASAFVETIIAPKHPSACPGRPGGAMSAASVEAEMKKSVNAKPCAMRRNESRRLARPRTGTRDW
jgi:hypothetical protein